MTTTLPRISSAAYGRRGVRVLPACTAAQSLVEFALVAPLFFALTFGLLQFALWLRWANIAQEAARESATTASSTYLAQYRPGTWQQAAGVADDPAAWVAAESAGIQRGQAVLSLAPTPGQPGPVVWLTLNEHGLAPGQMGDRFVHATVAVWMPTLGLSFLPRLPWLDPYITQVDVRANRFYPY